MQTFLPYSCFDDSAKCLDDARLRKQLVEAYQLHQTNLGLSKGWVNHPAAKQWKGFELLLACYGLCISNECVKRGFNGNVYFINYINNNKETTLEEPLWLNNPNFHASHRSRLKFKGRVDATCYSLRSHLKVRSINEWLINNQYPEKNMFKHSDIEKLEKYCFDIGVKISDNWYSQFNWSEPDTIPYWWPSKQTEL